MNILEAVAVELGGNKTLPAECLHFFAQYVACFDCQIHRGKYSREGEKSKYKKEPPRNERPATAFIQK
jgi:hypothetical protein